MDASAAGFVRDIQALIRQHVRTEEELLAVCIAAIEGMSPGDHLEETCLISLAAYLGVDVSRDRQGHLSLYGLVQLMADRLLRPGQDGQVGVLQEWFERCLAGTLRRQDAEVTVLVSSGDEERRSEVKTVDNGKGKAVSADIPGRVRSPEPRRVDLAEGEAVVVDAESDKDEPMLDDPMLGEADEAFEEQDVATRARPGLKQPAPGFFDEFTNPSLSIPKPPSTSANIFGVQKTAAETKGDPVASLGRPIRAAKIPDQPAPAPSKALSGTSMAMNKMMADRKRKSSGAGRKDSAAKQARCSQQGEVKGSGIISCSGRRRREHGNTGQQNVAAHEVE